MDDAKEQLVQLEQAYRAGKMDRREFMRKALQTGAAVAGSGLLAQMLLGCARQPGTESTAPAPTAPAGGQTTPATPKKGGTLTVATVDKPVNMDPAFAELYASMQVYQHIFGHLVYMDDKFNLVPGLAKSWKQEGNAYLFDLVDNSFFHNGEKFTAKDVKYTFDRLFDPKLGASNSVFFASVDKVEVVSDYQVRISVKDGWGGLLYSLAAFFEVVNQKGIESNDPKRFPIGNGPFKFVEWVPDDHITLERWEKYHIPDRPYLDKVIFKAIANDTVRLTGLLTGEMQWVQTVPLQKVPELKKDPKVKGNPGGPYLPDMLMLNCTKGPLKDVRVRQAINWLIDRKPIVNLVFFGQAAEATECVSNGSPWYTGINPYKGGPNLEKAKALLKEAGYENGFTLEFAGQTQVTTQSRTAEIMRDQFKQAGITLNIQGYEPARWFEAVAKKEYDMTITYWSATVDPDHCYYSLCHSQSPWNFSGLNSPRADEVLHRFRFTADDAKRKEIHKEVVQVILEESPMIFLNNPYQVYWTAANVHGAKAYPTLELRLDEVWLA